MVVAWMFIEDCQTGNVGHLPTMEVTRTTVAFGMRVAAHHGHVAVVRYCFQWLLLHAQTKEDEAFIRQSICGARTAAVASPTIVADCDRWLQSSLQFVRNDRQPFQDVLVASLVNGPSTAAAVTGPYRHPLQHVSPWLK
jgi:hypothetical protein